MKLEIEIPNERLGHQLIAAFEGGSNYWVKRTETHPPEGVKADRYEAPFFEGGYVIVVDRETNTRYRLDLERIQKGIIAMRDKAPRHFANILSENDDAETGDVFLQCCLFGEIVYG